MATRAYYNEFDAYAAAWLRNLIAEGLIAEGDVDERSIVDVRAEDLVGYTQCHFFAGVAGWSLALRRAGWPDERPIVTASLPCQPFSSAGKQEAQEDPRHLWPEMFRLVRECRPVVCIGEQVQSAIGFGWLDGVSADLEGVGYAIGSVVLGAHSAGGPHQRQRLYWVADRRMADPEGQGGRADAGTVRGGAAEGLREAEGEDIGRAGEQTGRTRDSGPAYGVDDSTGERIVHAGQAESRGNRADDGIPRAASVGRSRMGNADRGRCSGGEERDIRPEAGLATPLGADPVRSSAGARGLADPRRDERGEGRVAGPDGGRAEEPSGLRLAGGLGDVADGGHQPQPGWGGVPCEEVRGIPLPESGGASGANFWDDFDLVLCRDGFLRRVGPGSFPLVAGIPSRKSDPRMGQLLAGLARMGHGPKAARRILAAARANRVGRLRGYGNALCVETAAMFIRAYMEARPA